VIRASLLRLPLEPPDPYKEYLHRIAIDPEERARALPEEKRGLAEAAARR
jgi:hypothetical protein